MIALKVLAEFIRAARPHLQEGYAKGFSTDTRSLQPGDLFVALRGEHFDGHKFLEQAQKAGACAAVVDTVNNQCSLPQIKVQDTLKALGNIALYVRRQYKGKIVAITGSSGKTTVKEMLKQILTVNHSALATEGNFNNQVGVPLTLFGLQNQEYAVIEMGTNQPGEIAYLTSIVEPNVSLVNNVGAAHIGGFGTLEAIALEKGAIYDFAGSTAIINSDGDFSGLFQELSSTNDKWYFACDCDRIAGDDRAQVSAQNCRLGEQESLFTLVTGKGSQEIRLASSGKHNISNALAAATCALALGIPLTDIAKGLANFRPVKGRSQLIKLANGTRIIDDTYNANPASFKAGIDYLSVMGGEKILVMGEMGEQGDYAFEAHRSVAEHAAQKGIEQLFFIGVWAEAVQKGFGDKARIFNNKQELLRQLKTELKANCCLLIKGSRSAKMEELVQGLIETEGSAAC